MTLRYIKTFSSDKLDYVGNYLLFVACYHNLLYCTHKLSISQTSVICDACYESNETSYLKSLFVNMFTNNCNSLKSSVILKQHIHSFHSWKHSSVRLFNWSVTAFWMLSIMSKWHPLWWVLRSANTKCYTSWDMVCKVAAGSL